jgi:hypothetical protein
LVLRQWQSELQRPFLQQVIFGIGSVTESIEDSTPGANDAMIDSMPGVIGLTNASTT